MSPKTSQGIPEPEEETPLLCDGNARRKETPLPITQIFVLLLLQLCEPITSLSINPYINQLVSELPVVGGDEKKGRILRRANSILVFCCGGGYLFSNGAVFQTLVLFGLSRSFSALVFSRCLHGMLNGNIGVMKSMMAELTDESNMARGFSLISVTWAVGSTIGPFIGGVLSRPQDRWPDVLSHPFWGEHPYFLPCLATAAYALLSFALAAIFLKETVNGDPVMKSNTEVNSDLPQVRAGEILDGPVNDTEKPLPLRALLTRPVVVSVANYCMISLLEMIAVTLIPLIWSTSVEFGGLGMNPASIGLWMAGYGFVNGVFQFVAFPRIIRRLGPRRVFIASILCFIPVYIMFPFENLALRHPSRGANVVAGLLVILQLSAIGFADMGFSTIFMYISSAAPNKRSLGATNGVAQTMVSIQRTIGPAAAASLFAFSLDNNILGGNFAYVVLPAIVWVGLGAAIQLPKTAWKHNEH
ncbi:MFS general substrate transporter [Lactarius psammicola]|nr:MFS general substrate transporter [Lactarius psammicola]